MTRNTQAQYLYDTETIWLVSDAVKIQFTIVTIVTAPAMCGTVYDQLSDTQTAMETSVM